METVMVGLVAAARPERLVPLLVAEPLLADPVIFEWWQEWPAIPEGIQGVQIVVVARIVERVFSTSAAARYLMEAAAVFEKIPPLSKHLGR